MMGQNHDLHFSTDNQSHNFLKAIEKVEWFRQNHLLVRSGLDIKLGHSSVIYSYMKLRKVDLEFIIVQPKVISNKNKIQVAIKIIEVYLHFLLFTLTKVDLLQVVFRDQIGSLIYRGETHCALINVRGPATSENTALSFMFVLADINQRKYEESALCLSIFRPAILKLINAVLLLKNG